MGLGSGRELRTLAPAGTAVAMTPDGKLAISASSVSVLSDRRLITPYGCGTW